MFRLYGTHLIRKDIVEEMLPNGSFQDIKGKYFTTSSGMRALLGHPVSPEARRFMGKSNMVIFASIPG
jgi:hypothetical protein